MPTRIDLEHCPPRGVRDGKLCSKWVTIRARRKTREQRKAEVSEKVSERVGKLKDRLGIS